jgi:bifunctional DNA-binding transcriptional regulator/antitoxin component of YhaV-PrlF toxin-antitoxin module
MRDVEVMTLTVKSQGQFPKEWRDLAGLREGGPVRVTALNDSDHSLLITPIRKARRASKRLAKFLLSCPVPLPVPERHVLPFK